MAGEWNAYAQGSERFPISIIDESGPSHGKILAFELVNDAEYRFIGILDVATGEMLVNDADPGEASNWIVAGEVAYKDDETISFDGATVETILWISAARPILITDLVQGSFTLIEQKIAGRGFTAIGAVDTVTQNETHDATEIAITHTFSTGFAFSTMMSPNVIGEITIGL
jgi:hypothetical protein